MGIRFLAFATLLFLMLGSCQEEREGYVVKKETIVESVYSSVIIEPDELYQVNALNSGYIDELLVQVGDSVSPDEVLFTVRDVQSHSTASNARLSLDIARSNYNGEVNLLNDLKIELNDALLKMRSDSITHKKNIELHRKGLLNETEFAQSEVMYSSSKTRYSLLKNRLARTNSDLKTALNQAQNNYVSSLSRSNDALVRNRLSGIVYDLFKETGEFVSVQEPVMIVGSSERFVVKMLIDEVDITKVALGQEIVISLEAYKGKVFKGVVSHISPKLDSRTQTFEVEGFFKEVPEKLYMGLSGEGNIVINKRSDVIVIPLEYLIDGKYVYTAEGKKRVKTGVKSLSHVEIVSGLKVGTEIFKEE